MGKKTRLKAVVQDVRLARLNAQIQDLVGEKVVQVERAVAAKLRSPEIPLPEIGAYLAESRGKRLRPTLLLMTAQALGYQGDQDVAYSAIYEFIHTATLVHDDIVDEALMRRGRASLNSRWGAEIAVLMGDFVFITAMAEAVKMGWSGILPLISETTLGLIRGELIQSHRKWDLTLTREENFEIIQCKTAGLFSACARTPAFLVDAPRSVHEALVEYGSCMGAAFQIVDDCLDFRSDERTLGKPVGYDLKEGKVTLPLILLMERGTPQDRAFVEALVSARRFESDMLEELVDRVLESGMVDRAEAEAAEYARRAADALSVLPPSPAREILTSLPEFVLKRSY